MCFPVKSLGTVSSCSSCQSIINLLYIMEKSVIDTYKSLEGQLTFVEEAITFLMNVLNLYNFENGQLAVSFNGGKDATVVLYLTILALYKSGRDRSKIFCIYFVEQNPFKEVDEFMEQQQQLLGLNIERLDNGFREGLKSLVENNGIKAVIMGTRSTDPNGFNQEKLAVTDRGYPPLLRVNPIIYWNYQQVWQFLKSFNIPYCKLYEQGYTYIGNQQNTVQNQHLKNTDDSYKPAWEADDESELQSRKQITDKKKEQFLLNIGNLNHDLIQELKQYDDQVKVFRNDHELKAYFNQLQSYSTIEIKHINSIEEVRAIIDNLKTKSCDL